VAKRKSESEAATMPVKELADVLGIGLNQAYAAVRADQVPTITIGDRKLPLREPLMRKLRGEAA
jgi:hypothetical protein